MKYLNDFSCSYAKGPNYQACMQIVMPGWHWDAFCSCCFSEKNDPEKVLIYLISQYLENEIHVVTNSEIRNMNQDIHRRSKLHEDKCNNDGTFSEIFYWYKHKLALPNILAADFLCDVYKSDLFPDIILSILIQRYSELKIKRVSKESADTFYFINQGEAKEGKEWLFYLETSARSLGVDYEFPPQKVLVTDTSKFRKTLDEYFVGDANYAVDCKVQLTISA